MIDKAKRDCQEEVEILFRYGGHSNIVTLRDVCIAFTELYTLFFLTIPCSLLCLFYSLSLPCEHTVDLRR